jgi:hypothetical protein
MQQTRKFLQRLEAAGGCQIHEDSMHSAVSMLPVVESTPIIKLSQQLKH